MLVHRLVKSVDKEQLYDIIIYLVPTKGNTLVSVSKVEYFFGKHWANKIYPSVDRSRGFPVKTSAYGPFLCTAELHFIDGGPPVMLHRYIDFEMGAFAPVAEVPEA
jgi:hypothetical protein